MEMTDREEVEYYRGILEQGLSLLCEALKVDGESFDSDQADGECYLDCFKAAAEKLSDASADADRYRFFRNEDNWGEDGGDDSWEMLGESHGRRFDEIVDSRMKKCEHRFDKA